MSTLQVGKILTGTGNSQTYQNVSQSYQNLDTQLLSTYLKTGPFNHNIYLNTTRTALSVVATRDLWTVTFNKLSPTSIIVMEGVLHFRENYNGQVGFFCRYGSSGNVYVGFPYMEVGENSGTGTSADIDTVQYIVSYITNYSITGPQNFTIGWSSNDGSANMPSSVWNPNNSDDARTRPDSGSLMSIWEIEP